jgi:hypothetical protein
MASPWCLREKAIRHGYAYPPLLGLHSNKRLILVDYKISFEKMGMLHEYELLPNRRDGSPLF